MSRSILKLNGTLKVYKDSEVDKDRQTLSSIYKTSKLKFGPINPIID